MNIGDRVTLPSGKAGVILPSAWLMPTHHLVQLDGGSKRWMLREILKPAQSKLHNEGKSHDHLHRH